MPLYAKSGAKLSQVKVKNFALEKELQRTVEGNLDVIFNCRFVASEFVTGGLQGGRIDTLALSEDGNPVIVEYKKAESSQLITQSLFYLHWINDHHGDFEIACQKQLGPDVRIDWSDVRVICLAPDYRKYDVHAAGVIGANIELWRYRRFENGMLYLEEAYGRTDASPGLEGKDPIMVAAGKKAAQTAKTGSYSLEEHLAGKPTHIVELVNGLRDYIQGLDSAIEEVPKKYYVAYRTSQNIACLEIQKAKIQIFLKLSERDIGADAPEIYTDMSKKGHFGTGDAMFVIKTPTDLETAKPFVERSYQKVGA
jgi:predicted transport protein